MFLKKSGNGCIILILMRYVDWLFHVEMCISLCIFTVKMTPIYIVFMRYLDLVMGFLIHLLYLSNDHEVLCMSAS